jgi:hypothetical protein
MGMKEMVTLFYQGNVPSHLENHRVMRDRPAPARRISVSVKEIASASAGQVHLFRVMMKKLKAGVKNEF